MSEEDDVVTQPSSFAKRVSRHDGRAEERARVEDLGLALLVLERDVLHRRALGLREIDAAVTDVGERSTAPLVRVGSIEVVAAHHVVPAREARRDGVAVRVIVAGAIREARDLLVLRPTTGFFAMGVRQRGGKRSVVGPAREMDAGVVVGRGPGRAFGAGEGSAWPRGAGEARPGDRHSHGRQRSTGSEGHEPDRGRAGP